MNGIYSNVRYCLNGHYLGVANSSLYVRGLGIPLRIACTTRVHHPEPSVISCSECGAGSMNACQHCGAAIVTRYLGHVHSYCEGCGKPFPWAKTALVVAAECTDDLDELTPAEKAKLKITLGELTTDTSRTLPATRRFRELIAKVAPGAAAQIMSIIMSVATEEVKRQFE